MKRSREEDMQSSKKSKVSKPSLKRGHPDGPPQNPPDTGRKKGRPSTFHRMVPLMAPLMAGSGLQTLVVLGPDKHDFLRSKVRNSTASAVMVGSWGCGQHAPTMGGKQRSDRWKSTRRSDRWKSTRRRMVCRTTLKWPHY